MTAKEFQQLEGKLRRTCYAVIFDDLIRKTDILDNKQINKLIKSTKIAIQDAADESTDFLVEHGIL